MVRIDESKPAFVLNILSQPKEATIVTPEPQISETREKYRTYFEGLIDELREKHKFTNARAGQNQSWYTFASDNSKIYKYGTSFAANDKVRADIYIDCGDKGKNGQLFDCLYLQRDNIEKQFGSQLTWQRLDEKRACRIADYRDGDIDVDTTELEEIKQWAIASLLKLKAVFPKRIDKCLTQLPATAQT